MSERHDTFRAGIRFGLISGVVCLSLFVAPTLRAQDSGKDLPPEKLVYPPTSLCLLDVRGSENSYPYKIDDFRRAVISWLRSADYMTVRTESDIQDVLRRNRLNAPDVYESVTLARIADLAGCDYAAYLRINACGLDRGDGFTIPHLFHRNKVTGWIEMDVALVDAKTGALQYSKRVRGEAGLGRSFQVYPLVDDPMTSLDFRTRELLEQRTVENLARGTFEAIMTGIQKPLGDRYICYWQDEVHIISDKPGLCPICGSKLVRIKR
jgi:hypothetical protein